MTCITQALLKEHRHRRWVGPGPRSLLPSFLPSFLPNLLTYFLPSSSFSTLFLFLFFSHYFRLFFSLLLSVYLYCSIFTIFHTLQLYSSVTLPSSSSSPLKSSLTPLFFSWLLIGRAHNLRYDPALSHRGYRNRSVIRYVRTRTLFSFIIFHLLLLHD